MQHPPLSIVRRTGSERFSGIDAPADTTLLRFWQWAMSDLTNNATRGLVAEYLVARAVGVEGRVRSQLEVRQRREEVSSMLAEEGRSEGARDSDQHGVWRKAFSGTVSRTSAGSRRGRDLCFGVRQ